MIGPQRLDILSCGSASRAAMPSSRHIRFVRRARPETIRRLRNLFVFCSSVELPNVAAFVSAANRVHRLRALFLHAPTADPFLPQMLDRARLRTLRNTLVHSDWTLPRRVLNAWLLGAQSDLIANATVADERLFVVSCEPETLEVPFDSVPVLRRLPVKERGAFTIAEDGSYLHWPHSDIHLDLDAIRSAVVPEWRDRQLAVRLRHDRAYGSAIAHVRKAAGLRQSDIKGLSARQVRRIEQGAPISLSALRLLAAAHGLRVEKYTNALAPHARRESLGEKDEGAGS